MIKKFFDNYWIQCALEAYKSLCVGIITVYLGLLLVQEIARLF